MTTTFRSNPANIEVAAHRGVRYPLEGELQDELGERSLSDKTPLVGRELELADLRRTAEDARSGALQVAVIEGVSGIGKSALAQHFTAALESWRTV